MIGYAGVVRLLITPYEPEEEARFWAPPPEWHAAQGEAHRRFAREQAEYRHWRESLTPERIEAYWPTTLPEPSGQVVVEFVCQSPQHIARYSDQSHT